MGDPIRAKAIGRQLPHFRSIGVCCGALTLACAYPHLEMNESHDSLGGQSSTLGGTAGKSGTSANAAGASTGVTSLPRGGGSGTPTTSTGGANVASFGGATGAATDSQVAGQTSVTTTSDRGGSPASAGSSNVGGAVSSGGTNSSGSSSNRAGGAGRAAQTTGGAVSSSNAAGGGAPTTGGAPTAGATASGGVVNSGGTSSVAGASANPGGASTGGTTTTDTLPYAVSAGSEHTCELQGPGVIQCWGDNNDKALGHETTTTCANSWPCSTSPKLVPNLDSVRAIAAGAGHTCAIVAGSDGSRNVKCWGNDQFGQIGNGTTSETPILPPFTLPGITTADVIAAGVRNTCVVLSNGTVQCWGDNSHGQLGDGSSVETSGTPVQVKNINGTAGYVAAGGFHACAVLSANGPGPVVCWGNNDSGQLGVTRTTTQSNVPVTVPGINNAVVVAVGQNHTCALLEDNSVKCWGSNSIGQLGNGTTQDSYQPVVALTNASLGDAVVAITAGYDMTCAAFAFGSVKCWGIRMIGNFSGNFTNTSSSTPVVIDGVSNVYNVTCGAFHCCAVLNNGKIQCWGDNDYGELGTGNTNAYKNPAYVTGF